MRASTKDNVEGTMHQVNGTIKEAAGKVTANRDREIEGKVEIIRPGTSEGKLGKSRKSLNAGM